MPRPCFFIILIALSLTCPAQFLNAQVAGNPTLRTLDISRLLAPRGSNATNVFRRYSFGSDRLMKQVPITQPNPLAFNNLASTKAAVQAPLGMPGLTPGRTMPRGTNNRVFYRQGLNRISSRINQYQTGSPAGAVNPGMGFMVRTSSLARTYPLAGTGFSAGANLFAGPGPTAGTAMTNRTALSRGYGFTNRVGSRRNNQALNLPNLFNNNTLSRGNSIFSSSVSPIGRRRMGTTLLRGNISAVNKPALNNRQTLVDKDVSQQRTRYSIYGTVRSNLSRPATNLFTRRFIY